MTLVNEFVAGKIIFTINSIYMIIDEEWSLFVIFVSDKIRS